MSSEIRVNSLSSRAGLSTVTFTDTGPIFSGITTFQDNSGFNVGTGGSIFSPASNTITLGTNNAERLRISSAGNVGIGTDIPGHILDLYNSAGTDCLRLNVNGGAGGSNKQNAIRFSVDGDVKAHMGLAVDAGRLISGSIANDFCLKGLGSNNILFATNSSERLRITSDGKVAIGFNAPAVAGLSISNSSTNRGFEFDTGSGFDSTSCIRAYDRPTTAYKSLGLTGSDIKFGINDVEKIRISSSGLAVNKNAAADTDIEIYQSADPTLRLYDGRNAAYKADFMMAGSAPLIRNNNTSASDRTLSIQKGTTDHLVIEGSGNVNIGANGSSNPFTYLRFGASQYGAADIRPTNEASHKVGLAFYVDGTQDTTINPTEALRITSGGDVLIGGQTAYTYDDTGNSNTILDIWNSGNNKRGILSLSGNTNAGASIGTIWFNNDNNSGASPGNNMKLSAAIQAQAVTTDGNAGDDAGARLQFLTKPESSPMTDSMIISGEGYVTKPRQPSFRAGRNSNYTPGAGSDIIFNTVSGGGKHNVGNHYNTSNGRFTAPVAGVYAFMAHVIWQGLSSGQNMADCFHIKINGTVVGYSGRRGEYIANETGNGGYYADHMTYQLTLAAGDYVTIDNQFNLSVHGNSNYTTFSGHLVC